MALTLFPIRNRLGIGASVFLPFVVIIDVIFRSAFSSMESEGCENSLCKRDFSNEKAFESYSNIVT